MEHAVPVLEPDGEGWQSELVRSCLTLYRDERQPRARFDWISTNMDSCNIDGPLFVAPDETFSIRFGEERECRLSGRFTRDEVVVDGLDPHHCSQLACGSRAGVFPGDFHVARRSRVAPEDAGEHTCTLGVPSPFGTRAR